MCPPNITELQKTKEDKNFRFRITSILSVQ